MPFQLVREGQLALAAIGLEPQRTRVAAAILAGAHVHFLRMVP